MFKGCYVINLFLVLIMPKNITDEKTVKQNEMLNGFLVSQYYSLSAALATVTIDGRNTRSARV